MNEDTRYCRFDLPRALALIEGSLSGGNKAHSRDKGDWGVAVLAESQNGRTASIRIFRHLVELAGRCTACFSPGLAGFGSLVRCIRID